MAKIVRSQADLATFCLVQAVLTSLCLPVILAWHSLPPDPLVRRRSLGGGDRPSLGSADMYGTLSIVSKASSAQPASMDFLESLLLNPRFLLQAMGVALLEAVSWVLPELQFWVFARNGYDHTECALNSVVFVMSGVVLGMVLTGPYAVDSDGKSAHRLVLALFWGAALLLLWLHISMQHFSYYLEGLGHDGVRIFFYILLGSSGACSIGFVNVALPLVCIEAHPVAETYSGGLIQLVAVVLSVPLNQWSAKLSPDMQFSLCALVAFGAAALMSAGLWPDEREAAPETAADSLSLAPVTVAAPKAVPAPVSLADTAVPSDPVMNAVPV